MNIVKGVADLIRRTSSGQTGDSPRAQGDRLSPPTPRIRFSEADDEAVLSALWERYENTVDKVEKRRLFHVFLKQFLTVFKNWEPVNGGQLPAAGSTTVQTEYSTSVNDIVAGCSAGHPAEIILTLTEEIVQLTTLISELNTAAGRPTADLTAVSISFASEGLPVLDALNIITRSLHNCRVFGYYGGIQKLTALMKGAVVQLKTMAAVLLADESFSNLMAEKTGFLQRVLVYVVSIICSFIDLNSNVYEKAQMYITTEDFSVIGASSSIDFSNSLKGSLSEARLHWHQKAVVSVMEAGGLNWLVELLRVIRRLSMKEQWTDMTLQFFTLRTLCSALSDNPRGQNHFKSIGGLEVLLDGLALPSTNMLKSASHVDGQREHATLLKIFELHVLSLEVLREAVFGNVNNLQFLCENGRVHKFANSFCSPAFMLQEYGQQTKQSVLQDVSQTSIFDLKNDNIAESYLAETSAPLPEKASYHQLWNDCVVNLSRVLCSFLLASEDVKFYHGHTTSGRIPTSISSVYIELSIKWFMRVLLTVFPCIKACSNQNEFPNHLWVFVSTLQHCVLNAFRKVLISSAVLLEVFRREGIWDLIFSENFFYFGSASEEFCEEFTSYHEGSPQKLEKYSASRSNAPNFGGIEIIQMEVISFVESAATSNGSVHNLPELSALLEALEQSACNPEIASVLAKSLLRILQLSPEKTIASFKTLSAVSRVLKVACILAQESKRWGNICHVIGNNHLEGVSPHSHERLDSSETSQRWTQCMEICMELFMEFFSVADDARSLILHDSTCIDCLFELFWEEGLRNYVLRYILDLMKIASLYEEDRKVMLYVCSKYLETFTLVKEREKSFVELSINILVGMMDVIRTDPTHYQALFRDGECFLHVVSLLNGNLDEANGEKLVLVVLQTLTCLLAKNDASKAAFRALVGKGYQTLQSLLLDFCQWQPSEALLNALLDMLVDGKFEIKGSPHIKNEDVIILYLSVLQKSSESLRHYGLSVFQQLLKDSLSNRASCVAAGMLNFLLDWFVQEGDDSVILKIAQLIQVIGGYSISGKDIRKIFALLRSEKVGTQQQYCSLLLSTVLSMLNEKGPTAFFDLNGNDSGIRIKTPVQWPLNKGFSFSCWLRVENFPPDGTMGLFKFLTENGRGFLAAVVEDKLIYESINLKKQCVHMHVNLVRKKWHFLCITHTIGRAFSGGSVLRCYLDGDLVSSERCRYAKVNELLTSCSIGTKIILPQSEEDGPQGSMQDSFPFFGQIGPLYLFGDAISPEQVKAVHSLGPSYMYSFLDNEAIAFGDNPLPSGILDAKDGLASKIVFGLNAQASDGKTLFNVSPVLDHALDKNLFEATIMVGTQLCSRRLLQEIIYCVGGVSVFFPLITQSDRYENDERGDLESALLLPVAKERLTAEVIELITSVLNENLANQHQMHLLSGFSILGFLLQSVPPLQLNMETLTALKNLFNVVSSCGLSELLTKEAISAIFLNPLIWLYTIYKVQREMYMFLIEKFDSDPRLLKSLCWLPRVIDIIRQCYWDNVKSRFAIGSQPLLHPITKQVIGERPGKEEIHKIRLLLLSLGEMSLGQNIVPADIKALIAFFETSHDMTCIEDVLHMVIRAVSQKPLLVSFLEQVNLIGGCHIFVNLLQREYEPIRLLSLQFIGRLLVGLPSEKKGPRFFNLAVGRSKSLPENSKQISARMQPLFLAISNRLFKFPQTDNLCATLFDVLLGGASPRQVLQKNSLVDKQRSRGNNSHFFLPQMLPLIFRFLSGCGDAFARMKIISDLLDLLDSNPLNIEALMEYGWNAWLTASLKLDVVKDYRPDSRYQGDYEINEKTLVMRVFSVVLCHYIHFIKGGWQQLEETVNFLLLLCEQGGISCRYLLCDIYGNLSQRLVDLSAEENIFSSQPCRDNTLYFLRLVDETLISEIGNKLPFPANSSESYLDSLELESQKDYTTVLHEVLHGELDDEVSGNPRASRQSMTSEDDITGDKWWNLFDNLWIVISEMNGKGPSKMGPRISASVGPSFGQRARDLVESLNIPAAEMAAVVVSGGIGNALSGKPNKNVDKAMALRGERCPRIVFRLLILYLCRSSLERASRCVQQFISLLPSFLATDDEQSKSRLQLFIWSLLVVRSHYGMLDDGARFHVIAHVIRETVNSGKSLLATSLVDRDDSFDSRSHLKETSSIHNLIQKDRVLSAVSDEAKYVKMLESDRSRQLQELHVKMDENSSLEINNQKAFEDEIQSSLNTILASDDSRRATFLLAHEEEQQNIAEKWMHMFRTLIDERGPWSANPFPNGSVIHWKLDKTEDTWRRRQKLRRNYHFDEKLCHPPSTSPSNEATLTSSETKSNFVGHIPEQMKQFLLKGVHRITDEVSSEPGESGVEPSGQLVIPEDPSNSRSVEVVKSSSDQMDIVQERKQLSSPAEAETSEVLMSLPCVLVTPKRRLAGQLAVMKDVLHFFGEFLVEGTIGSSVFKNLNASSHSESTRADQKPKSSKWPIHLDINSEKGTSDNVEAENLHTKQLKYVKRHRRWSIGKIKAVHWTRYLLRYTAIEIFFSDSVAPIFINFTSQKDAKEIGTLIVSARNELLFPRGSGRDKSGTISFVDRRVALEMAETARESWRRRDITNFEYLMILNTLAGRSYNDLTQYLVFPWILADYSSEVLDFNKSSTFRDLSKPVGALDSKRFEVFEERYRNFCDPDIPR
ncbi:hypothetical protein DITRI_Ditri05aG0142300 [Diplodiscus trichospermus]